MEYPFKVDVKQIAKMLKEHPELDPKVILDGFRKYLSPDQVRSIMQQIVTIPTLLTEVTRDKLDDLVYNTSFINKDGKEIKLTEDIVGIVIDSLEKAKRIPSIAAIRKTAGTYIREGKLPLSKAKLVLQHKLEELYELRSGKNKNNLVRPNDLEVEM